MDKLRINTPQLHADEVNVDAGLRFDITKDEKGKKGVTKTPHIELMFWDKAGQMVISRIHLDLSTAKKLAAMLKSHTDKVTEELSKKGLPESVKEQIEKQEKEAKQGNPKNSYFG